MFIMFKNVILPIDLSDNHLWEEVISKTLNIIDISSCKIHIMHVIPELGMNLFEEYLPQEWLDKKKADAIMAIQKLINNYIPQEISVELVVTKGSVSEEVLDYAIKVQADLILVTCAKTLGPIAKKIIKYSLTSVLVLRPE
jgi:nucleotide-binding universal stress UspA family protein